jgi:AraC family transcriptional regulator
MTTEYETLKELGGELRRPRSDRVVFSELARTQYSVDSPGACVNFVLDGEERYELGGHSYVLRQGQFLFLGSRVTANVVLPRARPTRALCVYVPLETLEWPVPAVIDAPQEHAGIEHAVLDASASPFGRSLARLAAHVAADPGAGARCSSRIARHVGASLPAFATALNARLDTLDAIKPRTRMELLRRVEKARAYLHANIRRSVSQRDLAKVVGLSQFHLARSFKAVHGIAPLAYHRSLRLRRAAAELAAGSLSSEDVAARFGYGEGAALLRALRRGKAETGNKGAN